MKISKIREMSSPDLEKELGELKTELFKLKFEFSYKRIRQSNENKRSKKRYS